MARGFGIVRAGRLTSPAQIGLSIDESFCKTYPPYTGLGVLVCFVGPKTAAFLDCLQYSIAQLLCSVVCWVVSRCLPCHLADRQA